MSDYCKIHFQIGIISIVISFLIIVFSSSYVMIYALSRCSKECNFSSALTSLSKVGRFNEQVQN